MYIVSGTDQDAPIALGKVNSEGIEITVAPEGSSDCDRDSDGGYGGIEQDLV